MRGHAALAAMAALTVLCAGCQNRSAIDGAQAKPRHSKSCDHSHEAKPKPNPKPTSKGEPTVLRVREAYEQHFGAAARTVWVDVRDQDEYRAGHIRGAVNIPLQSFAAGLDRIPADKIIILYCQDPAPTGVCTAAISAGRILLQNGYPPGNVKVLEPGPGAWRQAGYPTESVP